MNKYFHVLRTLLLTLFFVQAVIVLPLRLCWAQPQGGVPLNQVRTPASPAFVLLGIEPSSVERPSTPRALAASLLSATHAGDLIPRDYAIEVAPYWLTRHPQLTYDEYANPDIGQSILQTLSFSLATSRSSNNTDTAEAANVGFGMRALLSAGKPNSRIPVLRAQLLGVQNEILDAEEQAQEDSLKKVAQEIALKIQAEDKQRVGWLIEYAGAILLDFPSDNFDAGKILRWGLWATTTYRLEDPLVDFLGLARIIRSVQAGNEDNLFDLGGRIVWQQDRFSLSAEYVRRFGSANGAQPGDSWRLDGSIEYQATESTYISATFGRNFEQGGGGKGTLIAVLAVNLGFGEFPVLHMR